MMRILYLAPLVPSRSGSGGKRAIYNHLLDLGGAAAVEIELLCVDMEETGELADLPAAISVNVLPRAFARFASRGLPRRLAGAVHQLLFDRLPRAVAVTGSSTATLTIADALARRHLDCIVVDHFFAFGMVATLPASLPPLIYIAHNHEAEIWRDRYRAERRPVGKLLAAIEWIKTRLAERRLIDRAAAVVTLTRQDRDKLENLVTTQPLAVWPELSARKPLRWCGPRGKTLLFVGNAAYFPNQDAIRWLLQALMPRLARLDPEIRLRIVGTAKSEMTDIADAPNVDFLGFVDDESLQRAYLESALFICPVVLGSGVKIKVVEALSYGTPVALTEPSRAGVEFVSANLGLDRNRPEDAARAIRALLSDPTQLQWMSDEISRSYDAALAAKPPMARLLSDLLARVPKMA